MKTFLVSIVICISFTSCQTDDDSLAFIIPDKDAEVAQVEFTTDSVASPFYYLILAQQLIINWGDDNRPVEYVYFGNTNDWANIRPIEHKYAQLGTYQINIRTLKPFMFDFSKRDSLSASSSISKLTLTNCRTLSEFYCRKQPLTALDLSQCENLSLVDIGSSAIADLKFRTDNRIKRLYIDSTKVRSYDAQNTPYVEDLAIGTVASLQTVSHLESLSSLKSLYVRANITDTDLDLSYNDSLQSFSANNANLEQVNLEQLSFLESISVEGCANLTTLSLLLNPKLTRLELVDNSALSAAAIDDVFVGLPEAGESVRTIVLSGNAGDGVCDKSIATAKGWVFE